MTGGTPRHTATSLPGDFTDNGRGETGVDESREKGGKEGGEHRFQTDYTGESNKVLVAG